MTTFSPLWLEIVSELLVNLSAGWFAAVVIDTDMALLASVGDILVLTSRFFLGTLSLYLAKYLREVGRL